MPIFGDPDPRPPSIVADLRSIGIYPAALGYAVMVGHKISGRAASEKSAMKRAISVTFISR